MSKSAQTKPAPAHPTLVEFMRKKTKDACLVCQLPMSIRSQLGSAATKKGFKRPEQLEWLKTACGYTKLTMEMLNAHLNGHHDSEEELNVKP